MARALALLVVQQDSRRHALLTGNKTTSIKSPAGSYHALLAARGRSCRQGKIMDVRQNQCDLSQSLHSEHPIGHVLAVNGPHSTIGLLATAGSGARSTGGKLLESRSGKSRLIGVITDRSIETPAIARERGYNATAKIDLMGEIKQDQGGATHFERGGANYPVIGDAAGP